MLKGTIAGLIIGYLLTYFEVNLWFIKTVQPYITFEATDVLYYVAFAVLGCILIRD